MSISTILLPLFVQVFLMFALLIWMGVRRGADLKGGTVRYGQIALREPNWTPRTLQAAYAFSNQFEIPVLFFVLTILVIITRHADFIFLMLAWVFVATRVLHALVYVTSNDLRLRSSIFGVGVIVLFIMWALFAVQILAGV